MRITFYAIAIVVLASAGVMMASNSVRSTVDASLLNAVALIDVDDLHSKIDFDSLPVAEAADMI